MTDKATPRPWGIEAGTTLIWGACVDNVKGYPVAQIEYPRQWRKDGKPTQAEMDANAALIVRAVNRDALFDECVEALENLLRALAMGPLEVATSYGPDAHPDEPVVDAAQRTRDLLARIEEMES